MVMVPERGRIGKMEDRKVHSLGHRAFYVFLLRRFKFIAVIAIFIGLFWYGQRWVPADYAPYALYAAQMAALVGGAIFLLIVLRAFVEYRYYTYTFTKEAFLMTYGAIIQKELAAPYHQIQHVVIKSTMSERAIGVSQIIIFLAGADQEESQMKIVLPAVGRKKAKLVQRELLIRMQQNIK